MSPVIARVKTNFAYCRLSPPGRTCRNRPAFTVAVAESCAWLGIAIMLTGGNVAASRDVLLLGCIDHRALLSFQQAARSLLLMLQKAYCDSDGS